MFSCRTHIKILFLLVNALAVIYFLPAQRERLALRITSLAFRSVRQKQNQTTPERHCIEDNICKFGNQTVYYYRRTNFYELLERPVNYNASISHLTPVVPRIVHFCAFGSETQVFRFHEMLAVKAAARFVKPEKIFIWHDNLPIGKYMEETLKTDNLFMVQRDRPKQIWGRNVSVLEHVADIVRLEALLEYGGMYFDTDSIVVNPVEPLLIHDVTMGHSVSFALANGILFSKPWSDFFLIWHHKYKTFDDKQWSTHSVIMAFQLSQKYPNLIHVEKKTLCRPNYTELKYLFGNLVWKWKENNYVVHLYMRFGPKVERNPENIKTWNTTAGSIMRYIYYGNSSIMVDS